MRKWPQDGVFRKYLQPLRGPIWNAELQPRTSMHHGGGTPRCHNRPYQHADPTPKHWDADSPDYSDAH